MLVKRGSSLGDSDSVYSRILTLFSFSLFLFIVTITIFDCLFLKLKPVLQVGPVFRTVS